MNVADNTEKPLVLLPVLVAPDDCAGRDEKLLLLKVVVQVVLQLLKVAHYRRLTGLLAGFGRLIVTCLDPVLLLLGGRSVRVNVC
jgi:hypothetical protein